ncbi:DUF7289 family protein [Halorussus halophilus]|uniref:DUF7289 family protein n=1 Tax=Halorussus halophilus TaxID=2650975 RepID=UPI0017888C3E|nr:archaellin/type IV pilin N-terminal domain-containing protein [Halorussus halophilus]
MFGGRTESERGQSNVVGVVLLLGVTIIGTGLIVGYGSSALEDSKRVSEINGAEHAMTQLDSKASLVGIGDSTVQRLTLGFDGSRTRVENESGWLRINMTPEGGTENVVMNESLGAVVYENGDTAIAYEGGGVWKRTNGGATMISPPEVHYRQTTLTLPLVTITGRGPLSGSATIQKNGSPEPQFPVASESLRNPLVQSEVNLTVHSEYYQAWGRFFEQRTGGEVDFDHENQTATLRLVTPPNVPKISQGVASTSSQKLVIQGGGGGETFTNSYNSSKGDYDATKGTSGTIKTVGGVQMQGKAEIRGDLVSGGGEVELGSSNAHLGGNLSYGGSIDLHKQATVDGWTAANGSVAAIDPVGSMVLSKRETFEDNNDNEDTSAISGDELTGCDSICTLTEGDYYLEQIDLDSGDELVIDLDGGSVDLAVAGEIGLHGGTITVQNPDGGRVNVYMDASEFTVEDGTVTVPGDRSGKFRVYGPPGVDAEFTGSGTQFVGMLYAPDSDGRFGSISVTSHAEVYGALVGGRTTLQSGGVVHYDAALAKESTLPPGYDSAPHVTYLHVSVNRVNVTSS